MKKLLLFLLFLGAFAPAQAMQKLVNLCRLSIAHCQNAAETDSNASPSKSASIVHNKHTIEPLNFKKHKKKINEIFDEAFPVLQGLYAGNYIGRAPQGYVLLSDDILKGFIIIEDAQYRKPPVRSIEWFAVDASSRNAKIGTHLWDHMIKDARDKGIKIITLHSTEEAMPFYKKKGLGCESIGIGSCYWCSKDIDPESEYIESDLFLYFSA